MKHNGDTTNTDITWESSRPEVATVSPNGDVVGILAGTVTVFATAGRGRDSASITVVAGGSVTNQQPIARPGGPYTGSPGTAVTFDGSGSSDPDNNTPLTYAWSFGDGGTATGAKPTHTYAAEGPYTVTLVVTDAKGLASAPATTTATVTATPPANQQPVARPGGPYSGNTGSAITFDGSASSDPDGDLPLTYAWTFGDGGTATGAKPSHTYTSAGSYTVTLTVTDSRGLESAPATTTATIAVPTTGPGAVMVGAGDISDCGNSNDEATAKLLDNISGTVYTLGDNVYPDGTPTQFSDCYNPTWGRHKSRTHPTPGNHDYNTSGGAGYYGYFGSAAGDPSKGYYSYDLGGWHVIVMNGEVSMSAGSAQETWLRADLAGHPAACTLAMWHEPRFSSGSEHGDDSRSSTIWTDLYNAGADVVLNGHDHNYERFAPQTPSAAADDARGIREFVVGTGGEGLRPLGTRKANSEVFSSAAFGVLKLTLSTTGYSWQFVPVAGESFTDSGSGTCH